MPKIIYENEMAQLTAEQKMQPLLFMVFVWKSHTSKIPSGLLLVLKGPIQFAFTSSLEMELKSNPSAGEEGTPWAVPGPSPQTMFPLTCFL